MRRARLILSGLALILAAGSWRPASTLAQLPAGTPTYNVNAKWVTDRGSQVFNVKAYGATGNGTDDDTTAIKAAITAAGVGGTILFPPGNYLVSSQLQAAANHQTWSGYGANILCNVAASCVLLGSASIPDAYSNITFEGFTLKPGAASAGTYVALEDNAQKSVIRVTLASNSTYKFAQGVQNDDDQSEDLVISLNDGPLVCTASFCGAALYQANSGSNAGITWLHDSFIDPECSGNAIDWQSTQNHLTVSRSVLQAFSQFALRSFETVTIDGDTHWEQGSCVNPLNDGSGHALGGAGLILNGAHAAVEGNIAAGGVVGSVFHTNSAASSTYWYYVVGHTAAGGVTAPLLAGYLSNGPSTISGSAEVFAVWPALTASSVTTFDLLRTSGGIVPYGTGNFAVATGLAVGTYCTASGGLVCSFTDTVGTPSSYTIANEGWYPGDIFWPGNLVVFSVPGGGSGNPFQVGSYSGPAVSTMVVNAAPNDTAAIHVNFTGVGQIYPGGQPWGAGFIAEGNQYTANSPTTAQLIPRGSPAYTTKGFFNFGPGLGGGIDIITINDSNYPKTLADLWKHPQWDAADTALCGDPPLAAGACLRGPTVSQYIGGLPDGSHWATRTSSAGIADSVPHYGFQSTSSGAPSTPTLTDESSATTCLSSHYYYPTNVCFDGTNFEMASLAISPNSSETGATAPTWETTPGQTTVDGYVTWICLGAGSLAANTTYYFKTAGCTLGGCSGASSEASVTTANDSASHMALVHTFGTTKPGHTSYQVGCSTTTGTEVLLTAPYTGAYGGNTYALPAMGCSGSGSFNATDQTGYASVIGMCFNGANCNTSWPATGYATVDANGTAQTQRNTLNLINGSGATVSCADNSGASRTDCTVATSAPPSTAYTLNGSISWPWCLPGDFSCVSLKEEWAENSLTYSPIGLSNTANIGGNNTAALIITNQPPPDTQFLGWTTKALAHAGGSIWTDAFVLYNGTNWWLKWRFAQPQATTDEGNGEIFHIGLAKTVNVETSLPSMIGLTLDTTQSDTTWQFQTDNGSARTVQTTGVSLDDAFHTFQVWTTVQGEYVFQLDAGTSYCFTAAASGGCTTEGTVTVVNSAHLPPASGNMNILSEDIAESGTAVKWYTGRIGLQIKGLSSP